MRRSFFLLIFLLLRVVSFCQGREACWVSSIPISSSMPRIIYPLSAMMNIPGILSLVFKNPDSLVKFDIWDMPQKTWKYCGVRTGSMSTAASSVWGCSYDTSLLSMMGICVGIQLSERVRKCSSYLFCCRYPINLPQVVIEKAYPCGYATRHHTWIFWNEMLNLLT